MSISRTHSGSRRPRRLSIAVAASAIALSWSLVGPSAPPASASGWTWVYNNPTLQSCLSLISAYRHDGYRISANCTYSPVGKDWFFVYYR